MKKYLERKYIHKTAIRMQENINVYSTPNPSVSLYNTCCEYCG
jgi:hypothetical protein